MPKIRNGGVDMFRSSVVFGVPRFCFERWTSRKKKTSRYTRDVTERVHASQHGSNKRHQPSRPEFAFLRNCFLPFKSGKSGRTSEIMFRHENHAVFGSRGIFSFA